MKKIIAMILVLVMITGVFAGCGAESKTESNAAI